MHKLQISEIIGSSLKTYKSKFWFYVGISLFAMLISAIGGALFGFVWGVALAITYAVVASECFIYLKAVKGEKTGTIDTFRSVKDVKTFKRVFCGLGWKDLWILIWFLIPVAGIVFAAIRYYEYSLVPYLIFEREDLSPTQLKDESKKLTCGNKKAMFFTDLCLTLAAIIVGGILVLLSLIPYAGYAFAVIFVLYALSVVVFYPPLLNIIHANIYLSLIGFTPSNNANDTADFDKPSEEDEEALLDSVLPTA